MSYEAIVDTPKLIASLANLPIAVRITPLDETGDKWAWQTLEDAGISDNINDAISAALHSLTSQLLTENTGEPILEHCPYCNQWHPKGTVEQCPLRPAKH